MKTTSKSDLNLKRRVPLLAGLLALGLIPGCGDDGGGSGDDPDNGLPAGTPYVYSVELGVPTCSIGSPVEVSGRVFRGNAGFRDVIPTCSADDAHMQLELSVQVKNASVVYYDWRIVGWNDQPPHGTLENYVQAVDIDPASGQYIVRTSKGKLRYASTTIGVLEALTSLVEEQVEVTAWTADGKFTKGYFTLRLGEGTVQAGSFVNGTLTDSDPPSHGRSGAFADYYLLTGSGATTIEMTGFDTYLILYDSQLRQVARKDDGADNGGSSMSVDLAGDTIYYLEATSFDPNETGIYQLSNTQGSLSLTPSPWSQWGNCGSIAGNYSVEESITLTIAWGGAVESFSATGTSEAVITQVGCSFGYLAIDPSGHIPPPSRVGIISGNILTVTGEAYVTHDLDSIVSLSLVDGGGTITATGFTLDTSGYLLGTDQGVPYRIDYTSQAIYTRR